MFRIQYSHVYCRNKMKFLKMRVFLLSKMVNFFTWVPPQIHFHGRKIFCLQANSDIMLVIPGRLH